MSLLVDPSIEVLKEREIGGEEILDDVTVDARKSAQFRNDTSEQDNRQVCRIVLDAHV